MTKYGVPSDYDGRLRQHRKEFLTVLTQMVENSPLKEQDKYTAQDVELWKTWWEENSHNATLAIQREFSRRD